ncbi:MAG: HPr family phosphocarrier protein [bacterium]
MIEKILQVKNKLGLHARPAALLVQTTNKFKSEVKVIKGDQEVNGKSIMGILMLAAEQLSELTILLDGEDEQAAIEELERLFDSKFGEE